MDDRAAEEKPQKLIYRSDYYPEPEEAWNISPKQPSGQDKIDDETVE